MNDKNNSFDANLDSDLDIDFESLDLPDLNLDSEEDNLSSENNEFFDNQVNEDINENLDFDKDQDLDIQSDDIPEENIEGVSDISLSDDELDNILEFNPLDEQTEERENETLYEEKDNQKEIDESEDLLDSKELEFNNELQFEQDEQSIDDESNLDDLSYDDDINKIDDNEIILPEDIDKELEDIEINDEDIKNQSVSDFDEGVALSEDELDNILDEDKIDLESDAVQKEENYNIEPINIDEADDFTDNIQDTNKEELPVVDITPVESDTVETKDINSIEPDENDDEPIQLSEDELDDILKDDIELDLTQNEEQEKLDEDIKIDDDELAKEIISNVDEDLNLPPLSQVEIQDDESISLTQDELQSIISDNDIKEISEELIEEIEDDISKTNETALEEEVENLEMPPPVFDDKDKEEDAETISLTDDELHDIINEFDDSNLTTLETKDTKNREQLTDDIERETGIKKEELKKIISYLDTLFDQLPEETIKEFSRSEYFNLYKKVIENLGIYPPEN